MQSKWTESDIQALKAQEAKDLAVSFLHDLEAMERAPITAGQVQLKELQYGLKIKEAESEDNRCREAHESRIKELELQIAQERSRLAEQADNADRVRQQYSQVVEQVNAAQESLSIQLERATREYNVKAESLEAEFAARKASLEDEISTLQETRDSLQGKIQELTDLSELAEDVAMVRDDIEAQKASQLRQKAILDEEFEAAKFEKEKAIHQAKRELEAELVELKTQHRIQVTQQDMEAAKTILGRGGMVAVASSEWDEGQRQLQERREIDDAVRAEIQHEAEERLRRSYNITVSDVFDVTELFYREKSLTRDVSALRDQCGKLEAEIIRMRQHIEKEPDRIAKAVEAAKVQVQNNIEQGARSR